MLDIEALFSLVRCVNGTAFPHCMDPSFERRTRQKPVDFTLIINTNGHTQMTSLQMLISVQWDKSCVSVKQMMLFLLPR